MRRILKRQALQVHAVDPADRNGRQRDGAQHREHLHHLVGAVRDGRQVDVQRVVHQIALRLHRVQQAHHMVVDVADIGLVLGVDDRLRIALQVQRGVPRADQHTPQIDELALDGKDLLQGVRLGLCDHLVFQRVDAVVVVIDGRKIEVDRRIEDQVEQPRRLAVRALAPRACERIIGRGARRVGDGDKE